MPARERSQVVRFALLWSNSVQADSDNRIRAWAPCRQRDRSTLGTEIDGTRSSAYNRDSRGATARYMSGT